MYIALFTRIFVKFKIFKIKLKLLTIISIIIEYSFFFKLHVNILSHTFCLVYIRFYKFPRLPFLKLKSIK